MRLFVAAIALLLVALPWPDRAAEEPTGCRYLRHQNVLYALAYPGESCADAAAPLAQDPHLLEAMAHDLRTGVLNGELAPFQALQYLARGMAATRHRSPGRLLLLTFSDQRSHRGNDQVIAMYWHVREQLEWMSPPGEDLREAFDARMLELGVLENRRRCRQCPSARRFDEADRARIGATLQALERSLAERQLGQIPQARVTPLFVRPPAERFDSAQLHAEPASPVR